jgi:hypothetical protein
VMLLCWAHENETSCIMTFELDNNFLVPHAI